MLLPSRATGAETHTDGVATHFDKTGDVSGGCGVPPSRAESRHVVALNVWHTPGEFKEAVTPRPVPDAQSELKGLWDNGRNCGRWVRISLGDYCKGKNSGAAGTGICRGGTWTSDRYNGATLDAVVTDSCGDANEWCRSNYEHLDITRHSLPKFRLHGRPIGDIEGAGRWNNRKIEWKFIPAPRDRGDVKLALGRGASKWYVPLLLTDLPNGVHGVQVLKNGRWQRAERNGDNGQWYNLPPNPSGTYTVRIVDADDKLVHGGREYTFQVPASCAERCPTDYTPLDYRTSERSDAAKDAASNTAPAG
ncbi:RlpA-like double-psi beta-barrel domain-containing protein [Streptomyces sp. CA-250714]|uniref:RlpA-like double-psi beta-barrel domain-containing protein n=1 Tax=Streptomyces sp. CA-250714 TaxID=3240060 RepID=UPI003D8E5388